MIQKQRPLMTGITKLQTLTQANKLGQEGGGGEGTTIET